MPQCLFVCHGGQPTPPVELKPCLFLTRLFAVLVFILPELDATRRITAKQSALCFQSQRLQVGRNVKETARMLQSSNEDRRNEIRVKASVFYGNWRLCTTLSSQYHTRGLGNAMHLTSRQHHQSVRLKVTRIGVSDVQP